MHRVQLGDLVVAYGSGPAIVRPTIGKGYVGLGYTPVVLAQVPGSALEIPA